MTCVTQCLGRDSCNAFTYDEARSSCTLGYCVVSSATNVQPGTVEMYQTRQENCNSTPGFNVVTSGNTSACLWLSDKGLNYTDARADCRAKGANLITLKTVNKLSLVQTLQRNSFVGLDDISTEGTFVWYDDTTVVDESLKKQLFHPAMQYEFVMPLIPFDPRSTGQPDNFYNLEDCALYTYVVNGLNDLDCRRVDRYVCEKPCFAF